TDRRMFGILHRAAVKLTPIINGTIAIGEGIETCMAARQLGIEAVWALGSVGAISFFPVIAPVRTIIILGDSGKASEEAVKICAERWRRAGRRVKLATSEVGSDFNDALMMA